jgi:Rv2525c-like, glycoside hydrolase-like domain
MPMPSGFDITKDCTAIAGMIAQGAYDFVCRYYGGGTWKQLTQPEAQALSSAGVNIVAVYEATPYTADPTVLNAYFTNLRGVDDGTSAYHQGKQIGQPAGSAIYFAVDYDADPAVIPAIEDYFRGVASGFAACAGGAAPDYKIGVYGSGIVCAALRAAGLADFAWLSMSNFQGSRQYQEWDIQQTETVTLFAQSVDLDQAKDNYGGFRV